MRPTRLAPLPPRPDRPGRQRLGRRPLRTLAAFVALLAVVLEGCGTGASANPTARVSPGPVSATGISSASGARVAGATSAGASGAARPAASPSSTAQPSASGGRIFATIDSIDPARRQISFEREEFFVGDQATVAARQDGVIGPEDQLPEPIYVRDLHQRGQLPAVPNPTVTVLETDPNGSPTLAPVEGAAFLQGFAAFDESPYYWLTVTHGQVTAVDQQYVP